MLNQPDHQSFLIRQALSDQKGQCHQGIVIDKVFYRLCQQRRVAAQVPQKQKRAAALIAVGQRVVLITK
jgi:type II secretory pathway predicted ATPase ExeA